MAKSLIKITTGIILFVTLLVGGLSKYVPPPFGNIQKANAALSSWRVITGAAGVVTGDVSLPHLKAVSLDGAEMMLNSSENSIGFGTTWSISIWAEPSVFGANDQFVGVVSSGSLINNISIHMTENAGGDNIRSDIFDSSGTVIKDFFTTDNPLAAGPGVKFHIVLTWDGTFYKFYIDGVEDTNINESTDNSGSMTATNRRVAIGGFAPANPTFIGTISKVSFFDIALTPARIVGNFDSGAGVQADDRIVNGDYDSTAVTALVQQWLLGNNPADAEIGHAYISSGGINVSTNAIDVTAVDVVTY